MKGSILAAAALVGTAMADGHLHRRHEALHQRWAASSSSAVVTPSSSVPPQETCGCTTKVITYYGSPTLVPVSSTETPSPSPESTSTSTVSQTSTSTSTSTVTVSPSSSVAPSPVAPSSVAPVSTSTATPTPTPTPTPSPAAPLPTAGVTSFSSTGVYTVPATTLVVTDTTTVCGATSTEVPSGTHTYGGVTTVVDTDTVITCPYATQSPSGSTVTDVVAYTTYTCPVAGTYTVVPGTVTTVPSSTMIVYPTPSAMSPGTYTQPESTITVTRTDYTYVCPYATSGQPTSTAAPVAATTTAAPAPAPPATTTANAAAQLENGVAAVAADLLGAPSSSSSSSSSTAPASVSTGGLSGNGQYGMTFDPYTSSGACMTQNEVTKNIGNIANKGFNVVRVYSTDCNTLEYVGNACQQHGIKMIPGVYIDSSGVSGAQSQVSAIASWANWGVVDLIVVGNEAVNYGYATAPEIAGLVNSARGAFQSAGYTGQVTTSEPINIWQMYGVSDLCSSVDVVGANIHPFFNAGTTAAAAGTFVLTEYNILKNICGKDVLNLETGWPTNGQPNGVAVPGTAEQKVAIDGIAKSLGDKSVFFSYVNNAWTAPGAFGVEPFWGCADLF